MSTGLLILRLFVAFIFIMSGANKLFGGMDQFVPAVEAMRFPAPTFFAYVAALVEFVGGMAILLGIATRIFALLMAIVMAVAFVGVHDANIMAGMGAFAFLGITLALSFTGAGAWAIGCPGCRSGKSSWCCGMNSDCCGKEGCRADGCEDCACDNKKSKK